jgi:hypothetical protein
MTENRVSRRIRSGVMDGEVTKSYNCAYSDESDNYLGFGSSVLAIEGLYIRLVSVLAFNVSSDIKCIPNSLN